MTSSALGDPIVFQCFLRGKWVKCHITMNPEPIRNTVVFTDLAVKRLKDTQEENLTKEEWEAVVRSAKNIYEARKLSKKHGY